MTLNTLPAETGKLVLFNGPGKAFAHREFAIRPLNRGEILVKNLYTTICGSDLHTYCGLRHEPSPTVLGHEIVGQIVEIATEHTGVDMLGESLAIGDHITWTVFASDPHSPNSLAGIPQKGDNMFKYGHSIALEPEVFHGGLSEYCILKVNTAILKLPEDMPLPVAATLNCSVSTVAGALRLAGDSRGKRILITGMGHLGITCAAMCRDAGASWIGAADITEKRLEEALLFGADELFNLTDQRPELTDLPDKKLLKGSLDVVFDMSGSPDAMEFGIDCLAVGGTAIWIGAVFNTRRLSIDPQQIIRNLISIKGLHNYNYADFGYALDFMKRNWQRYPFADVVEKEFTLDQVQEAFEYATKNKPLRVGVRI